MQLKISLTCYDGLEQSVKIGFQVGSNRMSMMFFICFAPHTRISEEWILHIKIRCYMAVFMQGDLLLPYETDT